MEKIEFNFKSKDNITDIRAVKYIPEGKPKAILQIAHGMVEFIDRYEPFAKFLCSKGYLVVGNDHLGHGGSVTSKDNWGYFCENDGYKVVLEDLHTLTIITKKEYPNLPYFFLGHSMGSFFARDYIIHYGNELKACIVMGTGQQPLPMLKVAKTITRSNAIAKGWHYRSKTVNAMAMGANNKKWEPSLTHCDWLTKDNTIVEWYSKEPRCQYVFTLNGFYNLFSVMEEISKKEYLEKMPKDLPVLITSGEDDPVGNFSKDPYTVLDMFKEVGMKDVSIKLYPNDRHEILNELDKDIVFNDLYNYLESKK